MGSVEVMYWVGDGPSPAAVEAAAASLESSDVDAWAWAFATSDPDTPGFSTQLVVEGPDAPAFAEQVLAHVRAEFGVETLDEHELAVRFDPEYRRRYEARRRLAS
ncbi:hypothetical protein [Gordonia malaquae]|uniref:hypothetical protein n=1 Tax=Gordonia malaquae TaxID=410332 RepID=UPI003019FDE3